MNKPMTAPRRTPITPIRTATTSETLCMSAEAAARGADVEFLLDPEPLLALVLDFADGFSSSSKKKF
jgi:hypothetical protein